MCILHRFFDSESEHVKNEETLNVHFTLFLTVNSCSMLHSTFLLKLSRAC